MEVIEQQVGVKLVESECGFMFLRSINPGRPR